MARVAHRHSPISNRIESPDLEMDISHAGDQSAQPLKPRCEARCSSRPHAARQSNLCAGPHSRSARDNCSETGEISASGLPGYVGWLATCRQDDDGCGPAQRTRSFPGSGIRLCSERHPRLQIEGKRHAPLRPVPGVAGSGASGLYRLNQERKWEPSAGFLRLRVGVDAPRGLAR